MVLRTTGANWLTLMMRAERAQRGWDLFDSEWLLYGPTDQDVVQDLDSGQEEAEAQAALLAAE